MTTSNQDITIGMGASIQVGSDRYPGTVIHISAGRTQIIIQKDFYTRVDNNGMSECQEYTFQPDPTGTLYTATLRKNGSYCLAGSKCHVSFGHRSAFYDYSF